MSEKQFYYAHGAVWCTKKPNGLNAISINDLDNGLRVANWLNELNDENEQLKSKNRGLQSELQIFKEDVTHSNLQINKLADENKQLKHNNKMLSMKMSEVYTKYCLLKEFSEDTNPNDAVKRVLSELMQITKEYR